MTLNPNTARPPGLGQSLWPDRITRARLKKAGVASCVAPWQTLRGGVAPKTAALSV